MSLASGFNSLYARLDAIIIWPHGTQYLDEVLLTLEKYGFTPLKIYRVSQDRLEKFIDYTYQHDKVPYYHIRSKKKFIKKYSGDAFCIFFKNNSPELEANGDHHFRHIECKKIRSLKNAVREKFNPYNDGIMTDNHVIHATDDPAGTTHLLNYFGQSYSDLMSRNQFNLPHHIDTTEFTIEQIEIDALFCNVACGDPRSYQVECIPISKSPHYQFLLGDKLPYLGYVSKFRGYGLNDYYSERKLESLRANFCLDNMPPIVVKRNKENFYVVQDGLHRASLCLASNQKIISALVI